jgi:putative ABC transport system permease protein
MNLLQDVRFTVRTLRKSPAFAISAILALGLGIGANSAMFSVVDGVLLRPLPFPNPERLVNVWADNPRRNLPRFPAAAGNYTDWATQNHVLAAVGSYRQATFNLATRGTEPERFLGAICDPGFFATLQIPPALGRVFHAEENRPGSDGVLVLSYGTWQSRFGADPNIVGRELKFDGTVRSVIGVMPEGFDYPPQSAMWAPLALDNFNRTRRDLHTLRVIGRLKDGVTLGLARSDFAAIGRRLAREYPDLDKDEEVVVNPMLDDTVGQIRPALLLLLGAVAFVLLIACANVANLLLAQAAGRQREIAIRTSLGAARGRILQQMITESLMLACAGGMVGLGLAYGAFRALLALAPATIPRLQETRMDWRAVAFTAAVSLATGLLFGLAPAWHAARVDVNSLLKEGSRGAGTRNRLRDVLVAGQVAAALILLTGAGLLLRSFYNVENVDPGFNPEHLMTMRLVPADSKYRDKHDLQIDLARRITAAVGSLPGVESAAISSDIPLLGNPIYIMRFDGRPPVTPSQAPVANYFAVTPGFFRTMGMHITRGRTFTDHDSATSPRVAVVNQTLAERYFPGQDPIGKRLEIGFATPPRWREIIGVVADVKIAGLDQSTPVQVYAALLQQPSLLPGVNAPMTVLARTAHDPAAMGGAIHAAILGVDRSQPVFAIQPMTAVVSQSVAQRRLSLVLLVFFAASALFLAALGLYGVMAYNVAQRTSEIGIRMALGASGSQVLMGVERQGILLVLAGLAVGVGGALVVTRWLGTLLFHVPPYDPATFAGVAAMLLLVAMLACYVPARRAARVDPVVALRYE